uniref:Uncharacterized protein n=1 Tax=Leersia perrieri TaxID=77586 RepID=A0A0D9UXB1_9ORYZ
MVARWLKLLVLVSLVATALRATTSLLAAHVIAPPPILHGDSGSDGFAMKNRRRMEGALAAFDARRLRPHGGGGVGGFEEDKRLAPTGSNPLHN